MTKAGFAGDDAPRAVFRKSDAKYYSIGFGYANVSQHQLLEGLDTLGK
jgi:hypothetical protein